MAKANPYAWFPGRGIALIHRRKVDKHSVAHAKWRPYFETWELAHAHMVAEAAADLDRAKKQLKSAQRHSAKVAALTAPSTPAPAQAEGAPAPATTEQAGG